MSYSIARRGNQYGIVDDSGSFIDDWAGKKSEAEAKVNDLNASSATDGVVNAGNGEETTSESSAHAPFADSIQPENQETNAANEQDETQPTAKPNDIKVSGFKGFKLTDNGWQQIS